METSARNTFWGTISSVRPGAVNGEVVVDLGADGEMTSIITMGSISKLGLAEGSKVTAIVKATNVIMAVKKYVLSLRDIRGPSPQGDGPFFMPAASAALLAGERVTAAPALSGRERSGRPGKGKAPGQGR